MSKTKYPPNTGLVGHEIRRVFGLSCVRVEDIPGSSRGARPISHRDAQRWAVQEELADSVEVPKWGWAR
ncbi:unnamed protein product [Sphagnum jensenii]|uniref:Uncharacterized protein n=1 Tax=Sphagnum jensenii TaxID=128206 RepID=A0ABP0WHG0_9BRYO